jgi:DNA recombination protein RmuC
MDIVVGGIAGLAAGFAIAWFLRAARAQVDLAPVQARLAALEQQHADTTRDLEALKGAHVRVIDQHRDESQRRATAEERAARIPDLDSKLALRDQALTLRDTRIATLETQLVEERKTFDEQRKLLHEAQAALSDSFKALSADALKSNNQAFILLAKATLEKFQEGAKGDLEARHKAVDDLVKPLQESLLKVDGKLGEIEKERVASYSELNAQLKGLVELTCRYCATRRRIWSRRCDSRPCVVAGANCSSSASSRWPACSTTATSSNRKIARPKMVDCVQTW